MDKLKRKSNRFIMAIISLGCAYISLLFFEINVNIRNWGLVILSPAITTYVCFSIMLPCLNSAKGPYLYYAKLFLLLLGYPIFFLMSITSIFFAYIGFARLIGKWDPAFPKKEDAGYVESNVPLQDITIFADLIFYNYILFAFCSILIYLFGLRKVSRKGVIYEYLP